MNTSYNSITTLTVTLLFFCLSTSVFAQKFTYNSDVANFSIEFPGQPNILKTEGNTDIQYEDEEEDITYIVGYEKSKSDLSDEAYCKTLEEDFRSDDRVHISSLKTVDFHGITALRSQTSEEHKYQLFSYIQYNFKLNGYEITIMLMSKDSGLMMKDIKKFAESFTIAD